MYTRDIERMVRQFVRQRLEPEYIRHYLMETYGLGNDVIDKVFATVGLDGGTDDGNPMAAAKPKARDSEASQKQRSRASKFF